MKIGKHFIQIGLLFLFVIYACGGASVPPGAKKIGRYEGSFTSAPLSGSCQFDLYRLPDGSGTFEGAFQGLEEDVLEAQFPGPGSLNIFQLNYYQQF